MMNLKEIIVDSFLTPKRLKLNYISKLKKNIQENDNDWESRVTLSSKSFLNAMCFRVVAESNIEKQTNLIFPPIGLYYSVFHLSIAMLYLEHNTDINKLKNIHHGTLLKLVKNSLIQKKLISSDYESYFKDLQALREFCNYKFGYRKNLDEEVVIKNKLTDKAFDEGIIFIRQILEETGFLFRFQVGIGDGFGDDILDTYLSKEDKEQVLEQISWVGLTT